MVYFGGVHKSAEIIERGAAVVGNQRLLADALGVSPQAITKWKRTRVPAERVLDIERVTRISRHEVRPDLYPMEHHR